MKNRSGFGWLELVIGVLLVVLGVWSFLDLDLALTGMAYAYGVAAVIMGVADIVLYIQVDRFTGFGPILSLIAGITSVMAGVMLLAYPGAGVMALTLVFPIWFIAHCIARLSRLGPVRLIAGNGIYYLLLVINIIGLVLGMLMVLSPLFTLSTIRFFAGGYLILLGIDSIVMAVSGMGRRP